MDETPQKIGRTWADVFSNGVVLFSILGFLLIAGWFGWFSVLGSIPLWVFISIGSTGFFLPFLIHRAKDDSHIIVVVDGPLKMTEYRVGKRYNWDIEGQGLTYLSSSGTKRILLTDFDKETGKAVGSQLADFTQFDLVRDVSVFQRLSESFSQHLREERATNETVAIEVERRVSEMAKRYLGLLYGSLEPTEIEAALNITSQGKAAPVEMDFDEVVG
jgi:hypothetical protein